MSNLSIERQLAAEIIDLVEHAIREEHPDVDKIASEIVIDEEKPNTLLHGEAYYDLENSLTEKFIESRSKLLEQCGLSKEDLMTIVQWLSQVPITKHYIHYKCLTDFIELAKKFQEFASKAFNKTEETT